MCEGEGDVGGAGGTGGAGSTTTSTTSPSGGAGTVDGTTSTSGGSGGDSGVSDSSSSSTGGGSGGSGGSSGGSGGSAGGTTTTTGTDAGGSGGGPVDDTVRGKVINHWSHPVSGVTVFLGDQEVQTNSLGEFEFEDVPETYDIMIDLTYLRYGNTARYGWAYQGVTRRDPTLQVYGGLALRSSNILVSPTNVTAGTGRVVVTALGGEYGSWDREGDTAVYTSFSYFGPPSVTMYAHALQWVEVDDLPIDYVAYDSTGLLAFDSEVSEEVEVEFDLTESEVTVGNISGSVTSPSSDARRNAVYVRFASNALIQVVDDYPQSGSSFTYTVPGLPDASILVAAHEGDIYGEARAVAYQNGVALGETDVDLDIPTPAVLNAPAAGTVLEDDTVFSWSGDASAFLWFLSSDGYYEGMFVVTAAKELTMPTFPNGLEVIRPGDTFTWRVETHGDPESVDAMLGPEGFMGDFNGFAYDEPDGPGAGSGTYTSAAASWVQTE